MKISWETLLAAVVIATSVLVVGRYQISSAGTGAQNGGTTYVYRLDRWTGTIVVCDQNPVMEHAIPTGTQITCPGDSPAAKNPN
jgi:hypothetical protein